MGEGGEGGRAQPLRDMMRESCKPSSNWKSTERSRLRLQKNYNLFRRVCLNSDRADFDYVQCAYN